jgi:hypothetical protein
LLFVAGRSAPVHGNLARRDAKLEAHGMAIIVVAVLFGIVLFDAHDFINRRMRRA